jgi:hypothetical protein
MACLPTLPPNKFPNARLVLDVDFMYTSNTPMHDDFSCKVCLSPYVQPLELIPCEHVVCFACSKKLLKEASKIPCAQLLCPECRTPVSNFKPPNRVISNVVDAMEVRCLSCGHVSPRDLYVTHECKKRSVYVVAREWAEVLQAKPGRHEDAVAELSRALDLFLSMAPNRERRKIEADAALCFLHRARSYFALEKWRECHADADSAVKIQGTLGEAYYLRAAAAANMVDGTGAKNSSIIADLQTALSYDPDLAKAQSMLNRLGVASSTQQLPASCMSQKTSTPAPAAADTLTASSPPACLKVGDTVMLQGLVNKAHLNGKVGKILEVQPGKYALELQDDGSRIICKTENAVAVIVLPAAAVSAVHADPHKEAPGVPAQRGRPEDVIKNAFALLAEYWVRHGPFFSQKYKTMNRGQREAVVRAVEPVIATRAGGTMDANGEDLHEIAYLAPEININGLCGTGDGLQLLFESIAQQKQYSLVVLECVRAIHEALQQVDPRQKFLASHQETTERVVVESRTGLVCNTKITAETEKKLSEVAAEMMRKKENLEWVPIYVRTLALDRLALIVEFLLRLLIHFGEENSLSFSIPFRHIFGCLQCGKKLALPTANPKDVERCETCGLARYCSHRCKAEHASGGHKSSCQIKDVNMSQAVRDALDRMTSSLTSADVNDPTFALLKEMCNEAVNKADPFGNGDQSAVPLDINPNGKMQRLRNVWASGADFNPRNPHSKTSFFFNACYVGDANTVAEVIRGAAFIAKKELLNRRETLMRFSPLLSCIAGARGKDVLGGGDYLAVAKLLIDHGSDVNAKDMCGFSCVHHCCTAFASSHSLEILPLLIAKGANPNERNRFDETPILEPAMAGKVNVVRALIQAGADPYLKACHGTTSAASLSIMNPVMRECIIGASCAVSIKVGEMVVLRGLVNKPHLNGKVGKVLEVHAGKFLIELQEDGNQIMSKAENVSRCDLACNKCGKVSTDMKRCSRCKAATYCSESCQKAHWPQHKTQCKHADVIVVKKPAGAPQHTLDISTMRTGAVGGSAPSNRSGTFIVKIQVPINMGSMTPVREGKICIYDEKHSFDWMLDQQEQPHAFDALFNLVTKEGISGLKAYSNAVISSEGHLNITPRALGPQPW